MFNLFFKISKFFKKFKLHSRTSASKLKETNDSFAEEVDSILQNVPELWSEDPRIEQAITEARLEPYEVIRRRSLNFF